MITDSSQITDLKGSYIKASDDKKEEQLKNYKPVVSDPENMNPNQSFVFRPKEEVRSNNDSNKQKKHADLDNITPKKIDGKMVLEHAVESKKYKELEEIKKLKQEVKELKKKDKEAYEKFGQFDVANSQKMTEKNTIREQYNELFNEWSEINKKYNEKLKEYENKKQQQEKKNQQRKKKRTKKVVLNNANKIKKQEKEEKQNGLPPDVAAMQADIELIKDQIAQQKNLKKTIIIPRNFPCNIYGQPMIQTNVDYYDITPKEIKKGSAKISKYNINQIQAGKDNLSL